jgi:hypothetical protein
VLVVSTGKIKAKVSLATGRITFFDKDDNVLLKERSEKARSFAL